MGTWSGHCPSSWISVDNLKIRTCIWKILTNIQILLHLGGPALFSYHVLQMLIFSTTWHLHGLLHCPLSPTPWPHKSFTQQMLICKYSPLFIQQIFLKLLCAKMVLRWYKDKWKKIVICQTPKTHLWWQIFNSLFKNEKNIDRVVNFS